MARVQLTFAPPTAAKLYIFRKVKKVYYPIETAHTFAVR